MNSYVYYLENCSMIKLEIILLLLAFCYSVYYIFDMIVANYDKIKVFFTGSKRQRATRKKTTKDTTAEARTKWRKIKEKAYEAKTLTQKLSPEDKSKLDQITKRVHLNKVRWYNEKARTLIIEGLTLDKHNKKLNLELADIYESEQEFSKAEYIYRDLLEKSPDDIETLKSLAASLEMQEKDKSAINTYRKVHKLKQSDIDALEKLSDLTFSIWDYPDALEYTKLYLKQVPRDAEKIAMVWYCLEKDWSIDKAIEHYETVLQIQPYNSEIQTRVTKLQTMIKN